ncbi:MAG: DUF4142 domain-containing protein [Sphingomicrobium sp.]
MRIPILSTAFFALVLTMAGCNRSGDNQMSTETNLAEDAATNDALGTNAMVAEPAALPTDAASFANAVAASDMFEIESAKLAADKATTPAIKAFAAQLVTDHQKSTVELKAAAAKATPPLTVIPVLDAEQQGLIDQLKGANGDDFERRFVDQQSNAHQKALALLQNYAAKGDSAPLKDFASKAVTVVQGHLDHVNSIRK